MPDVKTSLWSKAATHYKFARHLRRGGFLPISIYLGFLTVAPVQAAELTVPLNGARVTQVIKEVNLVPSQTAPRLAVVNGDVKDDTAVRTGVESRTELMFADRTIARLGANTIFSFKVGTRNLELEGGAILLAVPKAADGAKITTGVLSAAITGTTGVFEYHKGGVIKILCLEGVLRAYLNNKIGESVLLHPGDILITNALATHLDAPNKFSIRRFMQTALLVRGFKEPLPPGFLTLIAQAILDQQNDKSLVETNLVIFGGGSRVSLTDPTTIQQVDQKTSATQSATPRPSTSPSAPE